MASPPPHPQEGDSWGIYRFQRGKGWVDKRVYQPPILIEDCAEDVPPERDFTAFDLSIEVKTAMAEPLFGYAKASGFEPVEVLAMVVEKVLELDLFDRILRADSGRALRNAGSPIPLLCTDCGGPRSTASTTGRCKACSVAKQRAAAKPKPPPPTCIECNGPRSPFSKSGKCKACFTAQQRREAWNRPPPPTLSCEICGKVRSAGSGRLCRPCYQAQAAAAGAAKRAVAKAPRPVLLCVDCNRPRAHGSGMRCMECYRASTTGGRIAAEPENLPVERLLTQPAPPAPPRPASAPRPANPPPPRPIPREPEPDEGELLEEVRIRAARHAAERANQVEVRGGKGPRPIDPLHRPEPHRTVAKGPGFSDAFLAQLEKVKAGAGIARVVPVPTRFVEGGSGSSLGDVG